MHLRDFPFILRYFPNKEHKVKPIAQAAQTVPTVPIAQAAQTARSGYWNDERLP